jgi:nitrite reductase/ring-hydroxylating ferredoxin subunit
MKVNYPFNCWYVAATSDELAADSLLARRVLDTPVVMYRSRSGQVIAMEDRCVHRAYPLSQGERDGDHLVCGYHGFTFDSGGCLVHVPSQPNVPAGVCVRTFAIHEHSPFVWIWLGEPDLAALHPLPSPWQGSEEEWALIGANLRVEANFLLLHDHYLDLTNMFAMYPQIAPPGIDVLPPLDEVEVSEMAVRYTRVFSAAPPAEWETRITGLDTDTLCKRSEKGIFVSPALHIQRYAIGTEGSSAYQLTRVQGFTPESPTATHVFLQIARDFGTDSGAVDDHLRSIFVQPSERDAAVLEIVHELVDAEPTRRNVNVKADRAAVRARRVIKEMVDKESGRGPGPPFGAAVRRV